MQKGEVKMINVEESFVDVVTQIQEKMQSIICNFKKERRYYYEM